MFVICSENFVASDGTRTDSCGCTGKDAEVKQG